MTTYTLVFVLGWFIVMNALIFGHIFRKRRLLQKEKEKKLLAEAAAQAEEDIEKWIKEQEEELEKKIGLVSLPQNTDQEIISTEKIHNLDKYAFRA